MKYVFSMTLAVALLASAPAFATGGHHGDDGDEIDVMTLNQYLGTDLDPIINAPPEGFNDAVIEALEQVAANNFPARAYALGKLIALRGPELVGLQEVFVFTCTDLAPPTPGQGCDNPRIRGAFNDHLPLTLEALADLHAPYAAVATVVNFNTSTVIVDPLPIPGIPFVIDGFPALANILDRDVILLRGDLDADPDTNVSVVDFTPFQPAGVCLKPSADGCNYQVVASATLADGTELDIERGYVAVDVTIGGRDYRFVDTHLEVQRPDGSDVSAIVQALQAAELIQTLAGTTPPGRSLIVVGDINSSSEDPLIPGPWPGFPPPFDLAIIPPYTQFVGSGYTDAWNLKAYPTAGFTCCQDADLRNKRSKHDERIDVIFSGPADAPDRVKRARVFGSTFWSKTWSTYPDLLWPSDHGSVAAELVFDADDDEDSDD